MTDRDAPHKNPARVPLVLQALDDPTAHHEPAHLLTEEGLMARTKIEKDGIYQDTVGNRFFMAAGDFTTRDLKYVGTREERARQSAPENKAMPPAPENRSEGGQEPQQLDPLGELSNEEFAALSPAEKGARTRKANEQQNGGDQGEGA